jgi:aryl-alcohol dehydrogenase-like predicted oxidoreductase
MSDVMDYDFDQLVEAFAYLDRLRETGLVNMFGSSNYVANDLGHDTATARSLVAMWMKSYDADKSVADRATAILNV